MTKIFISAGDNSGDLHGANLMKELKLLIPGIEFVGIGGQKMKEQGLNSLAELSEISVVGFWEVAKKYTLFKKLLDNCKQVLADKSISAFVPIDYPGFNLRLAEFTKNISKPVIYYIAPQLWAWGRKRAAKLAASVDKLLVVFPFEENYFKNFGIDTYFVGHPLLDIPKYQKSFPSFNERLESLLFMPGSRKQEIIKHLPLLTKTALEFHKTNPNYKIYFAKGNSIDLQLFNSLKCYDFIEISNSTKDLMLTSKAGIIKTGTSTLEAALSGLPFSMYYITSLISYQLGKRLINLEHISLPNILLKKSLINEFIQSDAKPELLVSDLNKILNNTSLYQDIQDKFYEIRKMLGQSGAAKNAASIIANSI